MSDILRQVDEELRQDRLINIWKKYRVYIICVLILIIGSFYRLLRVYKRKSKEIVYK